MPEPISSTTSGSDGRGFLSPAPGSRPVDHCFRCGRETPPGVGLCDEHNPKHVTGPSATQMHATVLGGMALGVIGFFVLAGYLMGSTGPFDAQVTSASLVPGGGVALSFTVINEGSSDGIADCRVTRDGVARPDDLAFRTDHLPGGGSVAIEKVTPAPPGDSVAYELDRLTVVCS